MPYKTDERLKSYLDTNQLHREQMCRAILAADRRFSAVRPRHPRGGPDGGRDIEGTYREEQVAFGAVGFINQANDSAEQKRTILAKFSDDLSRAVAAKNDLGAFIFFTNVNLTITEKDRMIEEAKRKGVLFCEIFDRERLRIALDGPDGFSTRFQYLNIPLSEEEQATFFARWGDDLQSIISTGFEKIQVSLNRLMFLHEVRDPLNYLTFRFELDREYPAEEIGHFRLFCSAFLKEPKRRIFGILFGSSDKAGRIQFHPGERFTSEKSGIQHGISGGQWEWHVDLDEDCEGSTTSEDDVDNEAPDEGAERFVCVGSSSSVGRESVRFISISYSKDSLWRFFPGLSLYDLDESMFLPYCNASLAGKIKAIHIFSNGYKLQEIHQAEFILDKADFSSPVPVEFSEEELEDRWVRIRPENGSSTFHFHFFEATPARLSEPRPVENTLPGGWGA